MRTTKARSTGTVITVGSAIELDLDPEDGGCKWYTVCDTHRNLVGHRTKALALGHSREPENWCDVCMAYVQRASGINYIFCAGFDIIANYEDTAKQYGEVPHDSSKLGRRFVKS